MVKEQKFKTTEKGTKLPLLNLRGKDYLQIAHRLVWFREVVPNGIIKTQMLEHQNESALFRAEIYITSETGQALLVATAHKKETASSFPDYIEKAETSAVGRALAMAGYGTQFEPEFDEGMRLADAPIDPVVKSSTVETTTSETTEQVARPTFRKKIEQKAASGSNDDI